MKPVVVERLIVDHFETYSFHNHGNFDTKAVFLIPLCNQKSGNWQREGRFENISWWTSFTLLSSLQIPNVAKQWKESQLSTTLSSNPFNSLEQHSLLFNDGSPWKKTLWFLGASSPLGPDHNLHVGKHHNFKAWTIIWANYNISPTWIFLQ